MVDSSLPPVSDFLDSGRLPPPGSPFYPMLGGLIDGDGTLDLPREGSPRLRIVGSALEYFFFLQLREQLGGYGAIY